uniref:Immunoglobulin C1-set domain-containing protein n=1 Tax=Leptobrachium leishanense TaxID=445787 RepID=A0A8C5QMD5_9ANUR
MSLFGRVQPEYYNLTYHHTYLRTMTPDFFADLHLSDILVYWYDSNNKWLEPHAPWRRNMADPNFWRNLHAALWHDEHQMRNISSANETVQYVHGCMQTASDSFAYYFQTALHRKEILRFDTVTGNYSSDAEGYEAVADALNENATENAMRTKELTSFCEDIITYLTSYGKSYLNRKAQPDVMVFCDGRETLQCRAYGHYPREIDMTWFKDGKTVPEEEVWRVTLPLSNENYLSVASVNISSMSQDTYTCHVNHSSREGPVTVLWNRSGFLGTDNNKVNYGYLHGRVIAITVIVIVLVIVPVFGFIMWSKKRRDRLGSTFTNDPSS